MPPSHILLRGSQETLFPSDTARTPLPPWTVVWLGIDVNRKRRVSLISWKRMASIMENDEQSSNGKNIKRPPLFHCLFVCFLTWQVRFGFEVVNQTAMAEIHMMGKEVEAGSIFYFTFLHYVTTYAERDTSNAKRYRDYMI